MREALGICVATRQRRGLLPRQRSFAARGCISPALLATCLRRPAPAEDLSMKEIGDHLGRRKAVVQTR